MLKVLRITIIPIISREPKASLCKDRIVTGAYYFKHDSASEITGRISKTVSPELLIVIIVLLQADYDDEDNIYTPEEEEEDEGNPAMGLMMQMAYNHSIPFEDLRGNTRKCCRM